MKYSIKQSNISYIMTHRSEKDYSKTTVNLSIVVVSTGAYQCRGPPSTLLLDPGESLGSNLQFHLKQ
jgi:hypothetical protein